LSCVYAKFMGEWRPERGYGSSCGGAPHRSFVPLSRCRSSR